MTAGTQRGKAIWMLMAGTAFWAISFPTIKALNLTQDSLLPGGSSWFFASLCVTFRFGLASLALLVLALPGLRAMTALEVRQGLGIGLFGGIGIILQTDGLAHTSASTSAFLSQCYCIFIPLWISLRSRRLPSLTVLASCAMVMAGVAVLSDLDLTTMRIGRGELETILSTVLFTGQILWLERPVFAGNDVKRFSMICFAVMSLLSLPLAFLTAPEPSSLITAWGSPAAVGFLAILITFCTLGGYMIMNRWQREVPAVEAGLIYCLEPIFAGAMALFLPHWLSLWAGIHYANETLNPNGILGGALILGANILIQVVPVLKIRWRRAAQVRSARRG